MNFIDVIVIAALVIFAITGWRNGFVVGLLSFLGFISGGLLGSWLAPLIVRSLELSGLGAILVTAGLVIGLAVTCQILGALAGRRIRDVIKWAPAQLVDSMGGAALNVIAIAVICWLLAALAAAVPAASVTTEVKNSRILSTLDVIVPTPARDFVTNLRTLVDDSGLPQLFDSLGALPTLPIDPPSVATVRDPDVQAALASVVKVRASSYQCGVGATGSGFVVAPERIITNAHVVAAVDNPTVVAPNIGELSGRVVYFDPRVDVAVLAVPGLTAPPLQMAGSLDRGENTVIAGYPGGGDMTATAARVRGIVSAELGRGTDIYGNTGVQREFYVLRGVARPGNSGGPLLTSAGSVGGVVFAQAETDPETAFALTSDQVQRAVAVARSGRSEPVSTGPCKAI